MNMPALPAEITPARITAAALPGRVEAARMALARCEDLSEVMNWKNAADGLAALAKTLKVAPELIASTNRLVKDAILRMGQLLVKYPTERTAVKVAPFTVKLPKSKKDRLGRQREAITIVRDTIPGKNARTEIAETAGIPKHIAIQAARVAEAPRATQQKILADNKIKPSSRAMAAACPSRQPGEFKGVHHSDAMRRVTRGPSGNGSYGLHGAKYCLKTIPLNEIRRLTTEERKTVYTHVTECLELLDAISQRLDATEPKK